MEFDTGRNRAADKQERPGDDSSGFFISLERLACEIKTFREDTYEREVEICRKRPCSAQECAWGHSLCKVKCFDSDLEQEYNINLHCDISDKKCMYPVCLQKPF